MDDLPKAGLAGQPGGCIAHRNTPTQTHTHRQKLDNRLKAKALNICVPHFVVYVFVGFPVYTNLPNIDELPKNGDSQGLPQTHTQTHSRDAPCSPQEAIRNPLFHYPSTFCLRQVSIIPQKDVAPPPTCEHRGKWVSPVNNVVRTLFSLNTCCLL